jgi:hypothetical protein
MQNRDLSPGLPANGKTNGLMLRIVVLRVSVLLSALPFVCQELICMG